VLVKNRMTSNPITVRPGSDPMAARTLMRYGKFRRLPVVNSDGELVGIITDSDLEMFFSSAPSPGVVKRQYRVDQVMKSPVITVGPDYPLEEAAQLMLKHKVGALAVVKDGHLVGMITESDIFAQFVEALGGDTSSVRVTVQVPDRPGEIARVAHRIAELNCNICSIVSSRAGERVNLTMRVQGCDCATIQRIIQEMDGIDLIHIWESAPKEDKTG
jgi:acetoin utilization protein AcuB